MNEIRFDAQDSAPITQVNFDLRYSLKDQLDAVRKDLMTLTSQLQRLGKVKLVAADHHQGWLVQLKLLDNAELFKQSSNEEQTAASEMCQSDYRKILLMRG
ncbi:MAG: dGTP triphosphohydrolase [Cocleimonas sp.]|jgi:dGTP triphosphohydrolase